MFNEHIMEFVEAIAIQYLISILKFLGYIRDHYDKRPI